MTAFDLFVGVYYSGAETPGSRLPGLQVYAARPGAPVPGPLEQSDPLQQPPARQLDAPRDCRTVAR